MLVMVMLLGVGGYLVSTHGLCICKILVAALLIVSNWNTETYNKPNMGLAGHHLNKEGETRLTFVL